MSLLRLLTVGKTLIGIKGKPEEYKLTQEKLVPKFSSEPPNWSATARPRVVLSCPPVKPANFTISAEAEACAFAHALVYGTQAQPDAEESSSKEAECAVPAEAKEKKGPEEEFVPAKFVPKAGSAQGELPLLNVVRNDLTDADLEVAPLRARSVKAGGEGKREKAGEEKETASASSR